MAHPRRRPGGAGAAPRARRPVWSARRRRDRPAASTRRATGSPGERRAVPTRGTHLSTTRLPADDARALRHHRLRAVQPVDRRRRDAFRRTLPPALRARLQPDGILTQWLQITRCGPNRAHGAGLDARRLPHLAVWSFHHGDLIVPAKPPLPAFDPRGDRDWTRGVRDELRDVWTAPPAPRFISWRETTRASGRRAAQHGRPPEARVRGATQPLSVDARLERAAATRRAAPALPDLAAGQALRPADRPTGARRIRGAPPRRGLPARRWPTPPRAPRLACGGATALELRQPDVAQARPRGGPTTPAASEAAASLALLRLFQGRTAEAVALLDVARAGADAYATPARGHLAIARHERGRRRRAAAGRGAGRRAGPGAERPGAASSAAGAPTSSCVTRRGGTRRARRPGDEPAEHRRLACSGRWALRPRIMPRRSAGGSSRRLPADGRRRAASAPDAAARACT